ncbi:hypothetical protein F945_02902 [Acinetobacter rudis CIP 110305]|uniref:Uncharacterized protein n=1 Tax=Acinetobacter rudis CIP 110305 TaxID=421052 RepID=S3MWL6_9GAMM|nr:hypothetical protein F945_02902 [Acinetobacter rudis CIP 110305]
MSIDHTTQQRCLAKAILQGVAYYKYIESNIYKNKRKKIDI